MILQIISAFVSTFGFAIILNIERRKALVAGIGGIISWTTYILLMKYTQADYVSLFISSLVLTVYSEILAIKLRTPATVFSISALIPLVPGAYIYYTMIAAVSGDVNQTITLFVITIIKTVALALGILVGGGLMQIFRRISSIGKKELLRGLTHE